MVQGQLRYCILRLWILFRCDGFVILSMPRDKSNFKLAGILWVLAAFGLTHGTREFLHMWAIIRGRHPALDTVLVHACHFLYLPVRVRQANFLHRPSREKKNEGRCLARLVAPSGYWILFTYYRLHVSRLLDDWHHLNTVTSWPSRCIFYPLWLSHVLPEQAFRA